tara:strand:- start:1097 stop:1891 length:795 start_codon:yes stop_codon:yes gene_type:complete
MIVKTDKVFLQNLEKLQSEVVGYILSKRGDIIRDEFAYKFSQIFTESIVKVFGIEEIIDSDNWTNKNINNAEKIALEIILEEVERQKEENKRFKEGIMYVGKKQGYTPKKEKKSLRWSTKPLDIKEIEPIPYESYKDWQTELEEIDVNSSGRNVMRHIKKDIQIAENRMNETKEGDLHSNLWNLIYEKVFTNLINDNVDENKANVVAIQSAEEAVEEARIHFPQKFIKTPDQIAQILSKKSLSQEDSEIIRDSMIRNAERNDYI